MLKELVMKNRSYRRFDHGVPITEAQLRELIDTVRLAGSGGNKQVLRFALSWEEEKNARIFPCLKWAALLTDWNGPAPEERPTAYVILCADGAAPMADVGIAAQTLLLAAAEQGLGGCMIASFSKTALQEAVDFPAPFEPCLVIALGKPAERVVLEDCVDDRTGYYRDADGVHHVPKRSLDELILHI